MSSTDITPIENDAYVLKRLSVDVEVGNRDVKNFKPHFKLNRWGGECSLSLDFDEKSITGAKTVKVEGDVVKWETKNLDFHFYASDAWDKIIMVDGEECVFKQGDLGGFGFQIVFKQKPLSNQFSFAIQPQGLKFYYQPPLHPEHPTWVDEDGDGIPDAYRPENVVGSYAVYHATKTCIHASVEDAEKYKSGKAFSIYRPKLVDGTGKEAWASININEQQGVLTFIFSQSFLDDAVYPVVMGGDSEIFGFNEIGDTSGDYAANLLKGSWFSCPSAGTTSKITVYHNRAYGYYYKSAIYRKSDNVKVAETNELTGVTGAAWYDYTVVTDVTAQDYWLYNWNNNGYSSKLHYWDVVADKGGLDEETYNGWPTPHVPTVVAKQYSIYCTYEPSVSGWTGKLMGVTDPAKICGVAVADIGKVMGVA